MNIFYSRRRIIYEREADERRGNIKQTQTIISSLWIGSTQKVTKDQSQTLKVIKK